MRAITALLILTVFVGICFAEEEQNVLFVPKGSFWGPAIKFTNINQQGATMLGLRCGWILSSTEPTNSALVIGGGGYGVVTEVDAPAGVLPLEGALDIEFGYGGLELEYIFQPQSVAHYSIFMLIGGGANNFVRDVGAVTESSDQVDETDFVYVLEPAVNAELNVTKWFRFNAGVSYRLVIGADQVGLNDNDFNGITANVTFKFVKI